MNDITEGFRFMREASQAKRASNRQNSAARLAAANIPFTSHNNGAHLRVQADDRIIDFWPGTGLWHDAQGKQQRGVKKLIKEIQRVNG